MKAAGSSLPIPTRPPTQTEIAGDKGGQTHEFVSTVKELAPPGVIAGLQSFNFRISRADLPHESYEGASGTCRYFLRATVGRTATTAYATKELDIAVQNPKVRAWVGGSCALFDPIAAGFGPRHPVPLPPSFRPMHWRRPAPPTRASSWRSASRTACTLSLSTTARGCAWMTT